MRLEDLERELRAERPDVDPEFARELDEWAAAGFPCGGELDPRAKAAGEGRLPSALRRAWEGLSTIPPRRLVAPAGAVALFAVVAVGVTQVDFGGGNGDLSGGGTQLTDQSAPAEPAPPATDTDAPNALERESGEAAADLPATGPAVGNGASSLAVPPAPPDGDGGVARGTDERLQDKTARLSLGADADEVQEVANEVVEVTDRHDGIVLDSQVSSDQGGARATFRLEIPFAELDAALSDLSGLGDVISRTEAAEDVTAAFVRAEKERARILERIEELRIDLIRADTREQRLVLKAQLRSLEAQADAFEAQANGVERRARFATVAVTVTSNGPDSDDGWSLGDAVDDAGDVLRTIAGIGLVTLAVLVPIALVAGIAYLVASATRRRGRERALDS